MEFFITPVEPQDKSILLALMAQVISTSVTQDVDLQKSYIDNVTQNLHWWENHPHLGCHLKAVSHQEIVGVVLVKKFWNLCSLFVAPAYHRQGMGRALVIAAVEDCRARSDEKAIFLNAAPNAISFYRAIGFRPRDSKQPQPPGVEPMQLVL